MLQIKHHRNLLLSFIFLFIFTGFVVAQVDSTGSVKQDTTGTPPKDTTGTPPKKDDEKKKRTK